MKLPSDISYYISSQSQKFIFEFRVQQSEMTLKMQFVQRFLLVEHLYRLAARILLILKNDTRSRQINIEHYTSPQSKFFVFQFRVYTSKMTLKMQFVQRFLLVEYLYRLAARILLISKIQYHLGVLIYVGYYTHHQSKKFTFEFRVLREKMTPEIQFRWLFLLVEQRYRVSAETFLISTSG